MNSHKGTARVVGALFLTAMVASLLGGGLLEAVLDGPDYLANVAANGTQVVAGVLFELVNGIAVVGIAVMMFPIFRKHNEALAMGYVGFRVMEAIMQVVGAIIPLSLLTASQELLKAGAPDAPSLEALGTLFLAARGHSVGLMLAIFFSVGALLFYYLLYRSLLVPRWLSVWGIVAVVLVLTWNLLEIFGTSISGGMILALPIVLNEIFLGIWLVVKGFNSSQEVPTLQMEIDGV